MKDEGGRKWKEWERIISKEEQRERKCGENPKGNKIYLEIEEDVYSCLYEIVI